MGSGRCPPAFRSSVPTPRQGPAFSTWSGPLSSPPQPASPGGLPPQLGWFMGALGCGWGCGAGAVPLLMPGQALQPPTSGAGPAIQSWLLSPCPHVVLSRVAVASRQGGSVLCPQPVGDVRGACSTGLQGCGSAPSPSPASEMDAEGVPEPRGPAPAGPERTRCLCQLSLPWLGSPARTRRLHSEKGPRGAPLHRRGACTLRRDLVGVAHRSAVQQLKPCCTSGASLYSGAGCGNQLR